MDTQSDLTVLSRLRSQQTGAAEVPRLLVAKPISFTE